MVATFGETGQEALINGSPDLTDSKEVLKSDLPAGKGASPVSSTSPVGKGEQTFGQTSEQASGRGRALASDSVDARISNPLPFEIARIFPFTSRYINIAGYRMHYIDEGGDSDPSGEKPVVMLLHGNPTWSFYYRELIKELRTHFRVLAPDFLGLGLSDRSPHNPFRAKDRIAHLTEFIEKLDIGSFSLVMHDWGGSIGTGLAVRFPEKVKRIVYLNTTLTETEALPPLIKIAATPIIGKFLTQYTKQFLRFTTGWGVFRKLPKEVKAGYLYPYPSVSSRKAIWDFVDDIPFGAHHPSYQTMMELAEGIPKLAQHEVQIIWGLHDPCFHREMLTKVARHFPNAELIEIADASHLVLEDAPEIALPAIRAFLEKGPGHARGAYTDVASTHVQSTAGGVEENVLLREFAYHAQNLGTKPAVIEPLFLGDQVRYGQTSFRELQERIYKYERGLAELGLVAGDRVLMLVPPGGDFLALTLAVMGRGGVPIFVDPGMGRENLFQTIKEIDPQVLIGSPRAQLLRLKRREIMPNLKFHITASDWIYTGGPRLNYLKRFSSKPLPKVPARETAFIAFTSGATGRPKGVIYTNTMLQAQLEILRGQFGIQAGKRDLPLLPIFALFHLANGVCSVFPNIDPARPLSLSPERILKIIYDLEVNYSFGSPTLWNKIAEYAIRAGENFGTIEKIFMAGAPVPAEVLARVKELMVQGEVYTPYGATEALPVTLVSAEEMSNISAHRTESNMVQGFACGVQGTYVGLPVSGVSAMIAERSSLSRGTVVPCASFDLGEILVSGDNVSYGYYRNPTANERSKLEYKGVRWHRMGDIGYQDERGGLFFCGRVAHLVEVEDRVYYSIPTERIFNALEKVRRSALVDLGEGQEPGIVIEPFPEFWPDTDEKRADFLREIEQTAKDHELTRRMKWFFFHPSFPVDGRHNAKIFRDQLSDWARSLSRKQEGIPKPQ